MSSLQERLDAALLEKRELLALCSSAERTQSRMRGGTASNGCVNTTLTGTIPPTPHGVVRQERRHPISGTPASLASRALQQALEERAALLQLRAQRNALCGGAPSQQREAVEPSASASNGIPPSPTAFRLQEERQRLQLLQQASLEKLADVKALEQQRVELQAAVLAASRGEPINAKPAPSQSKLRASARPFTTSSTPALDGKGSERPAAISKTNSLAFVGHFRPEEQDATGAMWPFHVESTIALQLSRTVDSRIAASTAMPEPDSTLGFVLTRYDRISRKQRSNAGPGIDDREHLTTREWSGDCSLVPHHHVKNGSIEIDVTLRAHFRRNYHKVAPAGGGNSDNTAEPERGVEWQRQERSHEQRPHDETLLEPLVRGGRIFEQGHKIVVWGWGGHETVTLVSTATGQHE